MATRQAAPRAKAAQVVSAPILCRACDHSFAGVPEFDLHRHGRGAHGGCANPADITDQDGYLRMIRAGGVWRLRP